MRIYVCSGGDNVNLIDKLNFIYSITIDGITYNLNVDLETQKEFDVVNNNISEQNKVETLITK